LSCRTAPLRVGRSLRDVYWASRGAPAGRKQNSAPGNGLVGHLFVEVAVEPALVGLGGGDDGVLRGEEVFGGVLVF